MASTAIMMCGLIESTFVKVPVTATRVDASKMAETEWWAESDVTTNSTTTALPTAAIL